MPMEVYMGGCEWHRASHAGPDSSHERMERGGEATVPWCCLSTMKSLREEVGGVWV